ncbi:uncharacterized protein LOC125950683 [Anopheles darlingi]|uniref:uncharacterized protein LOC125950683 n=1 Tax=Anopheles darlingi TaxID=43151 RepID=UPI0021002A8F|nr:uncharacterized protein LOC125950683 [Anopheles darlingi]
MAFKFLTFAAVVAVAQAGLIASPAVTYQAAAPVAYAAAPIAKVAYAAQHEEYDPNPQYSYSYGISDALTGDSKSQQESRSGDVVQGSYSLIDADGFKRTVDYTADPHHGFNAVVRREPLAAKTVVAAAPVATKVIAQPSLAYAAPVAKTISYAAPVAKTYVSSPAVSYAAPLQYSAPLATKTIVSSPAISYAAPVAKTYVSSPAVSYAAPLQYSAPLATKTIVSSPAVSYAAPAYAFASPAVTYQAAAPVAYAAAPIAKVAYAAQHDEYDPNPQYSFSYGISDALTGDSKSQQESRSGDVVQGSYSLIDADGFKRTVDYTADPHHGFNAVVRREPLAAKTVVAAAPVATKVIAQPALAYAAPVAKTISYAAPVATKTVIAQPALAYAAPVAKTISYAAPVATKTVIAQPTLAYAAPVAKTYVSSPAISYAAPVAKTISYAAPVAKTYVSSPAVSYAAPLAYSAPLATKTIVSSPALSYAAPAYASYHAAPVAYAAAPIAKVAYAAQHDEYDPNPQYSFSYGISDALTGDSKSQQESRSGDVVQGSYSLIDADGFKRTVDYTADPHHGFNAVVRREPLAAKTVVAAAPVATKVIAQPALAYAAPVAKTISYAAPVATKTVIAQPTLAYAAPVAKTYVSSPAISYAAPVAKTISYAAPVAKTYVSSPAVSYAAPLAYSAPLATKTIVSSPALSYAAPAYASYH